MKRLLLIAVIMFCSGQLVFAWDDCPYGKTNDNCEFPGECGRYVDTNQDNVCDHSQEKPIITTATISQKNVEQKEGQKLVDNVVVTARSNSTVTDPVTLDDDNLQGVNSVEVISNAHNPGGTNQGDTLNKNEQVYHLVPITVVLLLFYFIFKVLLKTKKIKLLSFRRFWNTLLLISFLFVGLTGILLIIQVNFSLKVPLPFNVLYWHSEIGIIMFIVCVFHIIERWAFFKRMLREFI